MQVKSHARDNTLISIWNEIPMQILRFTLLAVGLFCYVDVYSLSLREIKIR